jgi:hypothetical protein
MKVRAETLSASSRYRVKWWPEGSPEPDAWMSMIEDDDGYQNGSIILIAHQLHATFGNVHVTPIEDSGP